MVDMETERQIQSAFKKLSVNRTMFVVAYVYLYSQTYDVVRMSIFDNYFQSSTFNNHECRPYHCGQRWWDPRKG